MVTNELCSFEIIMNPFHLKCSGFLQRESDVQYMSCNFYNVFSSYLCLPTARKKKKKRCILIDISVFLFERLNFLSLQDVINGIGGIQVLFPLLEQVNKGPVPDQDNLPPLDLIGDQNQSQDNLPPLDLVGDLNQSQDQDDWVVVPSSSYSGKINVTTGRVP